MIYLLFLTLIPTVILSIAITMIDLSDLNIIAGKPIRRGLNAFHHLYRLTCKKLSISRLKNTLKQIVLLV